MVPVVRTTGVAVIAEGVAHGDVEVALWSPGQVVEAWTAGRDRDAPDQLDRLEIGTSAHAGANQVQGVASQHKQIITANLDVAQRGSLGKTIKQLARTAASAELGFVDDQLFVFADEPSAHGVGPRRTGLDCGRFDAGYFELAARCPQREYQDSRERAAQAPPEIWRIRPQNRVVLEKIHFTLVKQLPTPLAAMRSRRFIRALSRKRPIPSYTRFRHHDDETEQDAAKGGQGCRQALTNETTGGHVSRRLADRAETRTWTHAETSEMTNLGNDPIFSEFLVKNPQSQSAYTVVIRGKTLGENTCTCGDFTTNTLGTCKHLEFVLACLEKRRGGKSALERGSEPGYSEVFLRYGKQRDICFRAGSDCPKELIRLRRAISATRAFSCPWRSLSLIRS